MAGQLGSFCSSVAFGYMPLKMFSGFLFIRAYLFTRIDPTQELPLKEPEKVLVRV